MTDREQSVLHRIGAQVQAQVDALKAHETLAQITERAQAAGHRPHDFAAAFAGPRVRVLAEIKYASPSSGIIRPGPRDPQQIAGAYLAAGAAALSVLTERDSFGGDPEYLRRVRAAYPHARLLMKDFVVDPFQLPLALSLGADAVLLIVALLGAARTQDYLARARALGLTALVEVHDEEEFRIALDAGATLVGVNNRNLKTLHVDLGTSERLARLAPPGVTLIAESGLSKASEIRALRALGYAGFLMGSHFMRAPDPGAALHALLAECAAAEPEER